MNKRRWIGCKKLTKADILKVEDCIKTRLPEDYRNQLIMVLCKGHIILPKILEKLHILEIWTYPRMQRLMLLNYIKY